MSEYVTVRLGRTFDDEIHWIVWSTESAAALDEGVLPNAGQLSELSVYCAQRAVYALVPGDCVTFHTVALPGKITRKTRQALPFLIEDAVASDLDKLHITVLPKKNGQFVLAVVAKEQTQAWIDWLSEAELKPMALLPDSLALPTTPDRWSAVKLGQQWIIRQHQDGGIVVEDSWLNTLLSAYPDPPAVDCYSALPDGIGQWTSLQSIPAMHLLAMGVAGTKINLLKGVFEPQAKWQTTFRPWYRAMTVVLIFFALFIVNKGLHLYQLSNQADSWKQQTVLLYRQLFPNEKNVVNPRAQMNQRLKQLQQQKSHSSFIWQLDKLQPVLAGFTQIEIKSIRFEEKQNEMRLAVSAADFSEFDRLRQAASEHFSVQQVDLKEVTGRVEGNLILRDKP